jgi:hypothetical protein
MGQIAGRLNRATGATAGLDPTTTREGICNKM